MKKILVVDDIAVNRSLLRQTLLTFDDYEIVEACNGEEAISQFYKEKPDLILMDIMMPDVDGCQAATAIKEKMGDNFTPIIFVTAMREEESLSTALASGGDDFISKPFDVEVLGSKIISLLRIRELTQELNVKNNLLKKSNRHLTNEQELVEYFFKNAIKQSFLDEKIIKYHMSSMSVFNGDLLLVQRAPRGGYYIINGDFSGHGLTAAMGTLPVAMVFFKMVEIGASVGDIAREINCQLNNLMPHGMFFAATIIELNARGDTMSLWMGGMPECYWLNKAGTLKNLIHSQHMPLGILDDVEFDSAMQVFSIELEDKLYLYSDGVIEAKSPEGELFGNERLKDILINAGKDRFDTVLKELKKFRCEVDQTDDTTLVELSCHAVPAVESMDEKIIHDKALSWHLVISISEDDMRSPVPVKKLSDAISAMPHLSRHRGVLHVLLSEIYFNALDHSILSIKSETKTDAENFTGYYKRRDDALLGLEDASVIFDFVFYSNEKGEYLKIQVEDSGNGYAEEHSETTDEMLYGRGLKIINSFSEKVSFSNNGRTLNVLYKL